MKTEERELIQSLLAPLTGLPEILTADRQQLASLLAPLAALPDAVRALARTQGRAHDAQNVAREAPATEQEVLDELAEAGGFELVSEDVRGREFEVIANYVRMGREYEAAGGKRGHDVELSEMYASGARDGRGQVWCAAGLDSDPPNDATAIVEALRDQGRDRALEEIDGACAKARVEMRFALCAALGLTPVASYEELLERLDRALEAERSQEHASVRLITEKERAEQRTQELQAELDTRFEEGREQGRAEGAAELDNLQRRAAELVRLLEGAEDKGRQDQRLEIARRAGLMLSDEADSTDAIVAAVRDGLDADSTLRDVRERAAQGALLAVLDERCPGARHERVGLGKVEDLPAVELRAEIARRWGDSVSRERDNDQVSDLTHELETARKERAATYAVLRRAVACTGCAVDGKTNEQLGQHLDDIARVTLPTLTAQRNAYMAQVHDLDRRLRAALDAFEIDHEGADVSRCVELLVASRNAWAKTLDEAESAYDRDIDALAAAQDTIATLDRILRPAVRTAGVSVEDATVIEIAERLVLVASRDHEALTAIDAELRRFLTACGEKLDGKERALDLARRLADASQRTVVEVPRSARDGARRELREIVSALGLRVEIDHLPLPEARAAVVRAVQRMTADPDVRPVEQFREVMDILHSVVPAGESESAVEVAREVVRQAQSRGDVESSRIASRALGQLCEALGIPFVLRAPVQPVDRAIEVAARAIREHIVNARHEELARGQRLVIEAVCALFQLPVPPADVAAQTWAEQLWKEHLVPAKSISAIVGKDSGEERAVGADTSSEQRASVLAAVQALGGELPSEPTLGEACRELDERIYALTYWAKGNLPLLALWDAQLVENCPLAFEQLAKAGRDMSDAHEDAGDWNPLARDLRAVAEGDDVAALAGWLEPGWDFRSVLDVVLDRVKHLEDECAEADDRVESTRVANIDRVEDLARALYERLPFGVDPEVVGQLAHDLGEVQDPTVYRALQAEYERARRPRDLVAWCAMHPTERNRLIDRTRDAIAAVAG